ncbi:MAG: hypothetical protein JOZ17_13270 [Acetobacteraceae bacterium]|nr:hypothetical protein [Acetobacteraceae bacterium]
MASYQLLNCQGLINQVNPVSVTTDNNNVAVSVTVNEPALDQIQQKLAGQKDADNQADSAERDRQGSL